MKETLSTVSKCTCYIFRSFGFEDLIKPDHLSGAFSADEEGIADMYDLPDELLLDDEFIDNITSCAKVYYKFPKC